MKMLEVTITVTLQIPDTNDKLGDCLTAVDAAKNVLASQPAYDLLRTKPSWAGHAHVEISRLRRVERRHVGSIPVPLAPLAVDVAVEE